MSIPFIFCYVLLLVNLLVSLLNAEFKTNGVKTKQSNSKKIANKGKFLCLKCRDERYEKCLKNHGWTKYIDCPRDNGCVTVIMYAVKFKEEGVYYGKVWQEKGFVGRECSGSLDCRRLNQYVSNQKPEWHNISECQIQVCNTNLCNNETYRLETIKKMCKMSKVDQLFPKIFYIFIFYSVIFF